MMRGRGEIECGRVFGFTQNYETLAILFKLAVVG